MKNSFILLGISIFIFCIVLFSILYMVLNTNNHNNHNNNNTNNSNNNNSNNNNSNNNNNNNSNNSNYLNNNSNHNSNNLNNNNRNNNNEYSNNNNIYNDYNKDPNYNLIYSEYQILGTLSSIKSDPETIILPLYGKRVKSYRWKYFTKVNNDLRIDIQKKRNNTLESCMKECEMLENGETIKIPAYTDTDFIVQLYDYELPF
jgi:cobalamin biosynthesis protein CobT